jgi:Spy/CpxP family protein refolding chaperone
MKNWLLGSALCAVVAVGVAQPQPPRGRGKQGPGMPGPQMQGPMMQPGPLDGLRDPQVAERLGISADQRKKIETSMQEHRLKQIDLRAALEKAQVTMQPLMNADQPDEKQILSQIDRVHQTQAELQKDEVRLQLDVRKILTADQWKKLQDERRGPPQGKQGPQSPQGRAGKNAPQPPRN